MAVIGKIREKSGLVMIVIGIGMLGFLFQDAASSLFRGSNDNSVGEIGGVAVEGKYFNAKYEEGIARWESQNRTAATEQIRESVREQVWNDIVREQVLGSQIAELGLSVSPQELFDMVQGNNPHPQVKQAFSNPQTGEFSSAQVLQFLKSLETMPVENKNQWLLFEGK